MFYHSIKISLNRHFLRPSHGFPFNKASELLCSDSCDFVVSTLRHLHQREDLPASTLILVYAIVMAAISIIYLSRGCEAAHDPRITFLLRRLDECGKVYKLAGEARTRLLSFLASRSLSNPGVSRWTPEHRDGQPSVAETSASAATWTAEHEVSQCPDAMNRINGGISGTGARQSDEANNAPGYEEPLFTPSDRLSLSDFLDFGSDFRG